MKKLSILLLSLSALLTFGCNDTGHNGDEAITMSPEMGKTYNAGQPVEVKVHYGNIKPDSIVYLLDSVKCGSAKDSSALTLKTDSMKMGSRVIIAKVYQGGKSIDVATNFVLFAAKAPEELKFVVEKVFPHDTASYQGDKFQLTANSTAATYTWSPATGLSDPHVRNPVVTVGALGKDVIYRVTASTPEGCIGEDFVRIKVYEGSEIYVPTGFTPNHDGKNDRFTPIAVGIREINYFKVFNRWGQIVFSGTTFNEGWDGKLSGVEQPADVYVWMVQGVTSDNRVITKKGTVVLIR